MGRAKASRRGFRLDLAGGGNLNALDAMRAKIPE
jgi:hypothetical protein